MIGVKQRKDTLQDTFAIVTGIKQRQSSGAGYIVSGRFGEKLFCLFALGDIARDHRDGLRAILLTVGDQHL